MIDCSCLCKKITFQLDGNLQSVRLCYCTNCRKFAGTSPAAWAMANSADLSSPRDAAVGRFDSGKGIRCFCLDCGSPLWFESKDYPGIVGIPLGVVDTGDIPEPEKHLWVQSNPAWCSIIDDKPKFVGGPDSAVADA